MKPSTKLRKWREDNTISQALAHQILCPNERTTIFNLWERDHTPIPERIFMAMEAIEHAGFRFAAIHYVYKLTDVRTGRFYFGSRSSRYLPHEDVYTGSSAWKDRTEELGKTLVKEIIAVFNHREQASWLERYYIRKTSKHDLSMNISIEKQRTHEASSY